MPPQDEPKKKLETTRGGSGRKGKTGVGTGDGGGQSYNFEPGASGNDEPPSTPRRKVLVCDRSALIRAGWRAMLHTLADVLEASDSNSTLTSITKNQPDLILLDLDLDGRGGLEICKQIGAKIPVLVATDSYHSTKYFHQLNRSGVSAIILKSSGPATLFDAFRLGSRETPFVDRRIAPLLTQRPATRIATLTDNEQEVLIRLDLRNKEISEELDIPLRRLEKLIEGVLNKLSTLTRTAAAAKATKMGYILLPKMPSRDPVSGMTNEQAEAERHATEAINRQRNIDH